MWPFPKRKKLKEPTMPRWMMWGVVAFLVWVMFINARSQSPDQQSPLSHSIKNIQEGLPPIESYTKLLPEDNDVEAVVLDRGAKAPLMCGQKLTIKIQAYADGAASGGAKTVMVNYGDKDLSPIVATALGKGVGVGSVQQFTFSKKQKMSTINPEALLDSMIDKVEVSITAAKPDLSEVFTSEDLNIKLFDAQIEGGVPAACGETSKIRLILWGADGKQVFSNMKAEDAPISVVIGSNQMMLGIEQAVIGMARGSTRIGIIPATWQVVADPVSPAADIPKSLRKAHQQMLVASILRVE